MNRELILALKDIMITAGNISLLAREVGLVIDIKEDNSPVTNADKEISQYIYDSLLVLTPDIPVICEERPLVAVNNSEMFWLVDPIDGTRSYIKNSDNYTVNIALIKQKTPVIGFVYQPSLKKLYYTNEFGNFCIEINEQISLAPDADEDLVAVVSSHNFAGKAKELIEQLGIKKIITIPSSLKLCMIAEGSGDLYPRFGDTMEWDIAAGHALITAAGGRVIDMSSGSEMVYAKSNFQNSDFCAFGKRL